MKFAFSFFAKISLLVHVNIQTYIFICNINNDFLYKLWFAFLYTYDVDLNT